MPILQRFSFLGLSCKLAVLYEYLMAPVKKNRKNRKNAYFLCKLWLNNH